MMNKLIGYVEGADFYLIVSLIIFIFVFVVASIQIFTMTKSKTNELANLPFNSTNNKNHEN